MSGNHRIKTSEGSLQHTIRVVAHVSLIYIVGPPLLNSLSFLGEIGSLISAQACFIGGHEFIPYHLFISSFY